MIDAPWYRDPVETLAFNMYANDISNKENADTSDNALVKAAARLKEEKEKHSYYGYF